MQKTSRTANLDSMAPPSTPPQPGFKGRIAVWLTVIYVLGGIALPIAYLAEHMRFHEGPPFFLYFVYFIIWSIPLHMLQRRAKSPHLQRTLGALVGDQYPVLVRDQPVSLQRRAIRIEFGIALCFLAIGIGGAGLIQLIGGRGAGAPLPGYSLATLAAADADKLPGYIRLGGTVAHPELAVVQDYSIKNSRYRDYYMPRTAPGSSAASAVTLIELDNTFPDDPADPNYSFNPPGPAEGELDAVTLPQDIAAGFAKEGVKVNMPVYLLTRKQLSGVIPGADIIMEALLAFTGILMAMMFGGVALYQRHSLGKRVTKFGQQGDHVGQDPDRYSFHAMVNLGVPPRWLCYLLPYYALLELSNHILLGLLCWPALAINIALLPFYPTEAIACYIAMGVLSDWLGGRKYRQGMQTWAPLQTGHDAYKARHSQEAP